MATIVLIHGFWVTPRTWENWVAHYEQKGHRVLAPGYPGFEVEVEALSADPTPIVDLRVPQIIEKLEKVVGDLDEKPILMGHSAGGAFTQILLDHGYGAAGVALNSAPTEGVAVGAADPGQVDLPRAARARPTTTRPSRSSTTSGTTPSPTPSRGGVARPVRALRHPGLGPHPVGQRAGQLPARQAGRRRRLPQRRPGPAAVRLGHRGPHHAARDPGRPTPSTTSPTPSPRSRSTRATPTCCLPPTAGRRSPTTSSTGRSSTRSRRQISEGPAQAGPLACRPTAGKDRTAPTPRTPTAPAARAPGSPAGVPCAARE